MTQSAERFVGADTFAALTGNPVHDRLGRPGEVLHVRLAHEADVAVVAPATANVLAKLALGPRRRPADLDAARGSLPAGRGPRHAHGHVASIPPPRRTSATLAERGARFVGPASGRWPPATRASAGWPSPRRSSRAVERRVVTPARPRRRADRRDRRARPTSRSTPSGSSGTARRGKMGFAVAAEAPPAAPTSRLVLGPAGRRRRRA